MLDAQARTYAITPYGTKPVAAQAPILVCKLFADNSAIADEHASLHQQLALEREQRKRAEEALRACQAELARAASISLLGRLAASIAHEVKQPLAAIVLNAQAGLQWSEPSRADIGKVQESLNTIIAAGVHAGNVVRSVCNLARGHSRARSSVPVNDVIHAVLLLLQGELYKHRVEVRMPLRDDQHVVWADPVQLQQVILNIVLNAIESLSAVGERESVIDISISKVEATDLVHISLADSGIGIDEGYRERIFEPLFSTKPEGMGIGLPLCRSIVEAHGGKIWVTACQPCGAAFHITLPQSTTQSYAGE